MRMEWINLKILPTIPMVEEILYEEDINDG
jgi:hypothetical protein